ncbi:MAG: ACT domain-containing protein [Alphaproteobacteria bacterium]
MGLTLRAHSGDISICLLKPEAPAPADILSKPMTYFMRTHDEVTLICPTALAPRDAVKTEDGWMAIEFFGPFDFGVTGILVQVAEPLAKAGVPIVALSTFGTDYILIKHEKRVVAFDTLRKAGHIIDAAQS